MITQQEAKDILLLKNVSLELYEEEFPKNWCLKLETKEINEAVNSINLWECGQLVWEDRSTFRDRWIGFDGKYLQKDMTNNYTEITFDQFKKHILKESTIMKNLLETEFVIENCSLGQRAAIKHYCEEKGIKQLDLETPKFNVVTFSNRQFKCFLTSSVPRNKITFSELIQFLDKYQPEPEFKIGDIVVVESWYHNKNVKFPQTCKLKDIGVETDCAPFAINLNKDHWGSNGTWNFKKGEFRHATPEEIKKWKEENEIKLPKISDYNGLVTRSGREVFLNWGCTQVSISTVKELLKLSLHSITLNGYMVDVGKVQQIKKFIEHNKL